MGIEELSDAELANQFKELTNEAAGDILEMSSKGMFSVNLKTLLHYTILLANETGALETNLDLHYLRMLLARKATQKKNYLSISMFHIKNPECHQNEEEI